MKNTFLFIFLFFITVVKAQLPDGIDSLVNKIPLVNNDTVKARLYKSIAEQCLNNNPAIAKQYADMGMALVTKMNWSKGIAVFNDIIGRIESGQGNYPEAIKRFTKSYDIHIVNKDLFNAANSLNNRGSAYQPQSNFEEAAKDYFAALKLAEQIPDTTLIATCFNNISLVHAGQHNLKKSLEYQLKAFAIQKLNNDLSGMAATYNFIGNTYLLKNDTVQAVKYQLAALQLYKTEKNYVGVASIYANLYQPSPTIQENLDNKIRAQQIFDSINPAYSVSVVNLGNLALEYLALAKNNGIKNHFYSTIIPGNKATWLQASEKYLSRAMDYSIANGDRGNYTFLKGIAAELEAAKGNYKQAYEDAEVYHELYDSTFSQENKNTIAGIEGQRELAIKNKEIELNKQAAVAQRKLLIAVLAVAALLGIIGFLLFRQSRLQKKSNQKLVLLNSTLDEANKAKAKFLAIISHDLRSPLAKLVNFMHLQKTAPDLLDATKIAAQQQKITTSAESLLQNMETLLLWSKGQMEQFAPNVKPVQVSSLFHYIEQSFAHADDIHFTFINPNNIIITTDENYVQTILHNLTANAVKALHNRQDAAISWTASKVQDQVIISISDNGPGIESAYLQNFLNEDKQHNDKTGFGLHLIYDLAKAINCKIEVDIKKGQGTEFNCIFKAED